MSKAIGHVYDENGKPLKDVTVNLNNGNATVEATLTDSDGLWSIDNTAIESANGSFEFLKSGYLKTYYPSNNYSTAVSLDKDVSYFPKIPWWAYALAAIVVTSAIYFYMKNKK